MGFTDAIKSFYRRYFDFSTRSSPSEYWWFVLFTFIVYLTLFLVAILLGGGFEAVDSGMEGRDDMPVGAIIPMAMLGIFALVNIIPGIALIVRRFHDRNMSGWWYLLFIVLFIIPLINLLTVIGFIVLMCLPGYPQPNKWGPNPLDNFGDTFA